MKHTLLLLFPLILLLFISCNDNSVEEYDDTEDLAFLEHYRLEAGVNETNSGLLYKVIEESEGYSPGAGDIVVIDLTVEHVVTGDVVIDTYDLGFAEVVPLELLVPDLTGLSEGVQLMNLGAEYEFVIPSQLAWRDGRVFRFKVELLNTQDQFIADYAQQENVTETESGMYYRVIEEGDGELPAANSTVNVNYSGKLINGLEFDSGESSEFNLSGVIDGFSEGLQLMATGSTYELLIPPNLAYGDQSPGYPGAALMFEVELIEILN